MKKGAFSKENIAKRKAEREKKAIIEKESEKEILEIEEDNTDYSNLLDESDYLNIEEKEVRTIKTIEELISDYNYYMNERHSIMNRLDYWVGCEKEESAMHDKISELSEKIYTVKFEIDLYHKLRNRNMILVKK